MEDLDGTHSYEYDPLYRLTEVTYPDQEVDTYTYDAAGNRLTKDTDDYTYDAADQLVDLESVTYDYDDNGNQTDRGGDTFEYDHENRLVETVIDSVTSTSVYNGDGLRMSHTVDQTTTDYIWDVAAGLPVVLQDGTNTYVYGLDLISATDGAGDQTYFTYDGLGSVVDLTDDEGDEIDGYTYDVFGAIHSQSGASDNYWLFTGEQHDADEGLYYLRARYYDPISGRFLGRDPIGADHPYAYVTNNPVLFTDPSGLCKWRLPCPAPVECVLNGFDCLTEPVDCILDIFKCTYEQRSPFTRALENEFRKSAKGSGGDFIDKEGGITLITNCRGLCELVKAPAFTVGHTIFTTQPGIQPDTLVHEMSHVRQYEMLGDLFWPIWLGSSATSGALCKTGILDIDRCVHDSNILEILAD